MTRLFDEFPPVSTAAWEAEIARDLKGRNPQTLVSKTEDGIELKPFYRSEDIKDIAPRELYRANHWKICSEVSDAESARYALSRGAEALYVESAATDLTGVPLDGIEVIRSDSPDLARAQGETPAHEIASGLRLVSERGGVTALEVAAGPNYFIEIAKFRAARLLCPRISNQPLRIFARTSKRNLTIYDPYVNLLRGTTAAMSAIIGGCDVLIVRPFDAAYANPGDFSRRLAINTQLILRDEAYLDSIPDPAAGCWYLEWLTDQVAAKAWELFESGATPPASNRNRVFIGVNRHADPNDRVLPRLAFEPDEQRDPWEFEKVRLAAEREAQEPRP